MKYLITGTQTPLVAAGPAFFLVLIKCLYVGTEQKHISRTDALEV